MEGTWDAEVEVELGPHIAFGRRSTGIFLVDTLKDLGRIAQNVESKWQASRQKGVLDWSLQNELWVARAVGIRRLAELLTARASRALVHGRLRIFKLVRASPKRLESRNAGLCPECINLAKITNQGVTGIGAESCRKFEDWVTT
ncbi:predicted protein [Sclerotinia sclerotiorum 1980 UF-70]|uniref:Uncharacterized protein n=1 Tax=Sclerotinia sclerotiorum (strain ATCC 18683 / 1980 / Ss-1) TaxID=665079 RepID=A7F067_SCLS1|nr:predicted protein [Sclerotinia sclerotiorum 1980 UF-70]EDN95109.1 predicted protein [Sclerotinia sclerotiorum 1980 UF-70]